MIWSRRIVIKTIFRKVKNRYVAKWSKNHPYQAHTVAIPNVQNFHVQENILSYPPVNLLFLVVHALCLDSHSPLVENDVTCA
jgi:hypothetical protein